MTLLNNSSRHSERTKTVSCSIRAPSPDCLKAMSNRYFSDSTDAAPPTTSSHDQQDQILRTNADNPNALAPAITRTGAAERPWQGRREGRPTPVANHRTRAATPLPPYPVSIAPGSASGRRPGVNQSTSDPLDIH